MKNKESDFQQFCRTMWAMAKYNVLPWMFAAGLVFGVAYGCKNLKSDVADFNKAVFEKQR